MPLLPNWKCDKGKCKLKVEDLMSSEVFRLEQKLYEMGIPETRREEAEVSKINKLKRYLMQEEHIKAFKETLSTLSSEISIKELKADGVRFFYEITLPNENKLKKNV